jgi:hypothetical protein
MEARFLIIYPDDLSTENLDDFITRLKEKFHDDDLPVYHIPVGGADEFIKESGEFGAIFYEKAIPQKTITRLSTSTNGARFIKGITLKDEEVLKFLSTL